MQSLLELLPAGIFASSEAIPEELSVLSYDNLSFQGILVGDTGRMTGIIGLE